MSDLPAVALLGFALAATPGPVNALAVIRGLRYGASQAFFLAAGAGSADVVYASLVVLGVGPFVSRPAVQIVLSLGGGFFLARLGLQTLLKAGMAFPAEETKDAGRGSWAAAYQQGFTVALLSPLTIVFWMSIFGGFYADSVARGSRAHPAALLAVLLLGANVWTCVVALLIHFGRRAIAGAWYRALVRVLSLVLLGFAARLLWSGTHAMLPLD